MSEEEKYNKEENRFTNLLNECTEETYVGTDVEKDPVKLTIRRVVEHHILQSGIHVYMIKDDPNLGRYYEIKHRDPNVKDFDRIYFSNDEISTESLLKNAPKMEMFNQEKPTIEFERIENKDIIDNKITYRVGNICAKTGKIQSGEKEAEFYESLYKEEYTDSTYTRYEDPISPKEAHEDMVGLLTEGIKNSDLGEEKKEEYIKGLKELSEQTRISETIDEILARIEEENELSRQFDDLKNENQTLTMSSPVKENIENDKKNEGEQHGG